MDLSGNCAINVATTSSYLGTTLGSRVVGVLGVAVTHYKSGKRRRGRKSAGFKLSQEILATDGDSKEPQGGRAEERALYHSVRLLTADEANIIIAISACRPNATM